MIFSSMRSKAYKRKSTSRPSSGNSADVRPGASVAAESDPADARLDGVEISEYARANALTEAQVWQRVRRGELAGRLVAGRYLLYTDLPRPSVSAPERQGASASSVFAAMDPMIGRSGLDGLLDGVEGHQVFQPAAPVSMAFRDVAHPEVLGPETENLPSTGKPVHSPDLALLIEHLNLARQENREIIRLSEESIRRVTAMSETIVAAKESQIADRDDEIRRLQEQLDDRDRNVVRLQQEVEDLEMLARSLE